MLMANCAELHHDAVLFTAKVEKAIIHSPNGFHIGYSEPSKNHKA